jgi:glutamyl-tRNA reductase
VSYAAVELAREIFGSLNGRKVMLVGAGKMSELAARHLKRAGCSEVFVTNRTPSRAEEMAALFDGQIVDYRHFKERLPEMDIVVTSSGAPHYLLSRDDMRHVLEARRNRPVFVIDIAVPRNVDPAVDELEHVYLYDIDDLEQVIQTNVQGRRREAEQAEEIITEEVDRLIERLESRQAVPAIVRLQEQLEQVRLAEIERVRGRLGELTPQQEQAIDALTRGIINKIAHTPITELRRSAGRPEGGVVVDVIRRLFRLDEQDRKKAGSK